MYRLLFLILTPPVTEEEEDIYVPPVTEEEENDTYVPPVTEEEEEVNEAPTFDTTSTTSIAENISSSSDVVTMSATDPNSNTLTYSITSGNDDEKFTINSLTGAIKTASTFDFESKTSYALVIAVSDGSLTTSINKTINVTNINEAPTIASTSTVSLAESVSSGTAVSTIQGSDVDASTTLTYSITGGNGASKFTINSSTGAITTAAGLDYETTTSYTLTISVSDGTNTTTTTQLINITDVAEVTQYTGTANSGTAISAWGANYSKNMVINNQWVDDKVLLLGEFNSGNSERVEDYFEDMGYTVTDGGDYWGQIDSYSMAQLSAYEIVFDLTVDNRHGNGAGGNSSSMTRTIKIGDDVSYKDALKVGATLYMQGENGYWGQSGEANPVLQTFVRTIDDDVDQSNNIHSGSTHGSNDQQWQAGTNNIYVPTSANGTYDLNSTTGYEPAPGKLIASELGGGNLIVTHDDATTYGHLAEWGSDELNDGYTGTYMMHLGGNTSYRRLYW